MTRNPEYCSRHTAYIYDRGGLRRIGAITQATTIQWGRQRDDISFAKVVVEMANMECQRILGQVRANRHELVIFDSENRRWEGPITNVSLTESGAVIEARDVMHYAYFTADRTGRKSIPTETVIERAAGLLTSELARKESLNPPINVVDHIKTFTSANDARTAKRSRPYGTTIFKDIDAMAIYSGLDYTVVGRSILLFDTHTRWAVLPQASQSDFEEELVLSEYGMQGATHSYATSHEGLVGAAPENAVDPYYGEWEIIDNAYDEEGTDAPTQSVLNAQASRNLLGKNPPALYVRVPQNASLSPATNLHVEDLVPGVRIPVRAERMGRDVDQMQKLDAMKVTETGGSVRIQVTMSPASLNDEAAEEGA